MLAGASFGACVLRRALVELYETLYARFYLYELGLRPSAVSFYRLDAENTPAGSIFFWTIIS